MGVLTHNTPSEIVRPRASQWLQSRRLPWGVTALALTILAAAVALTTFQVRDGIRRQIAGRDGEVLQAVAQTLYAEDIQRGLAGPVGDPADPLGIVLKCAEIRGVLGVRLFDADGYFVECFPQNLVEQTLSSAYLPALRRDRPVSRFHPRIEMWRLFYPDESVALTNAIPLLEVNVPLHAAGKPLAGIAQFLVAGQSIAAEYVQLDRRLWQQALTAFGAGAAVLGLTLFWVFRRLARVHRQLAERTDSLARANQELVLAAKTSALGAVTAHLLHGLKNPLAGLQSFVTARGGAAEHPEAIEWEQAVASTRRMQTMINQVVGVLREDQTTTSYEVTLTELEQLVRSRVQPLARDSGVGFSSAVRAEGALPNRTANLVGLILINLCENAVQATPGGRSVSLSLARTEAGMEFEVSDAGAGFPADTPLFMPCRSTKEGGSGIGLALCQQIAHHLGAELHLARSTAEGCVFALRLPLPVSPPKPKAATARL